jgi:hypothetical protein
MDVIFGTTNANDRAANIARQEQGGCYFASRGLFNDYNGMTRTTGISITVTYTDSHDAELVEDKGVDDELLTNKL